MKPTKRCNREIVLNQNTFYRTAVCRLRSDAMIHSFSPPTSAMPHVLHQSARGAQGGHSLEFGTENTCVTGQTTHATCLTHHYESSHWWWWWQKLFTTFTHVAASLMCCTPRLQTNRLLPDQWNTSQQTTHNKNKVYGQIKKWWVSETVRLILQDIS